MNSTTSTTRYYGPPVYYQQIDTTTNNATFLGIQVTTSPSLNGTVVYQQPVTLDVWPTKSEEERILDALSGGFYEEVPGRESLIYGMTVHVIR